MALIVGTLLASLGERYELVADVDERHAAGAAAQPELEDPPVEGQRLLKVADLERDVVDPHEPRSFCAPARAPWRVILAILAHGPTIADGAPAVAPWQGTPLGGRYRLY